MASSNSRSARSAGGLTGNLARRSVLLLLLAVWAFVFASLIGFHPGDPPSHMSYPPNSPVVNWCGTFGATVAYTLFKMVGFGAWVLVVMLGIGLLSSAAGSLRHALVRFIGVVMVTASIASLQHLVFPGSGSMPDLAGGLVGTVTVGELSLRFGGFGAGIILICSTLIGGVVACDEWLLAAFGWMWEKTREHGVPAAQSVGAATGEVALAAGTVAVKATANVAKNAGESLYASIMARLTGKKKRKKVRANDVDDDQPNTAALAEGKKKLKVGRAKAEVDGEETEVTAEAVGVADPDQEQVGPPPEAEIEAKPAKGKKGKKQNTDDVEDQEDQEAVEVIDEDEDTDEIDEDAEVEASDEEEDDSDVPGAPQVFDQEALKEKIAKLPIVFGQQNKAVATEENLRDLQVVEEGENYRFPGLDLLEEPEENFSLKLEEYVRSQAEALEAALKQYKIDGEVVGIESGPVITMYEVRLAPGTKVAAVNAVSSDIARALKSVNIRIVSNMAGRDTVGVEVPNEVKEKVRLKELMSKSDRFSKMKLPMFLGKDASGEPLIEDLAKMPHMLIAGTTGSGKSVCMNTIIMGFLYTKKPSELKLVLVDPKMVEMSQFKDIPHLMCPVVTEMGKAAAILEWATTKMDERYELLADAGCRDIAAYNELPFEELCERLNAKTPEEQARVPRKLPYMVFVIDELADLMMTNKEVEGSIIRIAQKARAVGIHLILATQRPQANVVTGLIKSNMPARVAFKVASGMDSRIVLDQKGGELLLGMGDMLFLSPSTHKLMRSQGTLVDDREIRRVVKFMKEIATPSFERQLLQLRAPGSAAEASDEERVLQSQNNSSASLKAAQEDPMFNRAVEIVLETKRGSVSLLQRRLAIGYTRASRLIDLMGIAGIISDHKGSVARDVQITLEEWNEMKRLAAEQAKAQGIAYPTGDTPGGEQQALFGEGEAAPAAGAPATPASPAPLKPAAPGPVKDRAAKSLAVDHNANQAPPFEPTNAAVEDDEDLGETSWDAEEDEDAQPRRRSA
ncbi:MAG TPA: DNA translocase FtsK [Phycisphaerales bacterium]|nr:DNA translocase FtsK [Phycisphaerales bacterium]